VASFEDAFEAELASELGDLGPGPERVSERGPDRGSDRGSDRGRSGGRDRRPRRR
jgi:hypothetical protein